MAQLLLLNPRRRRRKLTAKQRKYFGKRKRARRVSVKVHRPRRSRRSAVITVRANPRRRRRVAFNPRRIRRNPMRIPTARNVIGQVQDAAVAAVGATVVDVAMGYVNPMLPAAAMTPNVYPIVKGAAAILLGALGQSVGGQMGRWSAKMAEGSLIVTLHGVVRSFLPAGLALGYINSGYVPRQGMGAYTMKGVRTPLMGVRTPLMGLGSNGGAGWTSQMESETAMYGPGYVAGGMRGLGAYMNR